MLYRTEVGIREYWNHPQAFFQTANKTITGKADQGVWVNDLALIKLDHMITAEEFIYICLPDENTNYDNGKELTVYGIIKLLHIAFIAERENYIIHIAFMVL